MAVIVQVSWRGVLTQLRVLNRFQGMIIWLRHHGAPNYAEGRLIKSRVSQL